MIKHGLVYFNFYTFRHLVALIFEKAYLGSMNLEETAAGLEALGSPTRLAVYRLLVRAGPEGLAVGAIQAKTEVPRSTLSHHLHRLISVGLVAQERRGTTLICRANYQTMEQIIDFLTEECCADAAKGDEDAA